MKHLGTYFMMTDWKHIDVPAANKSWMDIGLQPWPSLYRKAKWEEKPLWIQKYYLNIHHKQFLQMGKKGKAKNKANEQKQEKQKEKVEESQENKVEEEDKDTPIGDAEGALIKDSNEEPKDVVDPVEQKSEEPAVQETESEPQVNEEPKPEVQENKEDGDNLQKNQPSAEEKQEEHASEQKQQQSEKITEEVPESVIQDTTQVADEPVFNEPQVAANENAGEQVDPAELPTATDLNDREETDAQQNVAEQVKKEEEKEEEQKEEEKEEEEKKFEENAENDREREIKEQENEVPKVEQEENKKKEEQLQRKISQVFEGNPLSSQAPMDSFVENNANLDVQEEEKVLQRCEQKMDKNEIEQVKNEQVAPQEPKTEEMSEPVQVVEEEPSAEIQVLNSQQKQEQQGQEKSRISDVQQEPKIQQSQQNVTNQQAKQQKVQEVQEQKEEKEETKITEPVDNKKEGQHIIVKQSTESVDPEPLIMSESVQQNILRSYHSYEDESQKFNDVNSSLNEVNSSINVSANDPVNIQPIGVGAGLVTNKVESRIEELKPEAISEPAFEENKVEKVNPIPAESEINNQTRQVFEENREIPNPVNFGIPNPFSPLAPARMVEKEADMRMEEDEQPLESRLKASDQGSTLLQKKNNQLKEKLIENENFKKEIKEDNQAKKLGISSLVTVACLGACVAGKVDKKIAGIASIVSFIGSYILQ